MLVTFATCLLSPHAVSSVDFVSLIDFGSKTVNGMQANFSKKEIDGASDVRFVTVGEDMYFLKKASQQEMSLFDSIIASNVLRVRFSDRQERFPSISLGVSSSDLSLWALSKKLEGYVTVVDSYIAGDGWPFADEALDQLDDLPYLYAGVFLIGGGDPHPGNVAYSKDKNMFGDVDLDVAFKWHIPFSAPNKEAVAALKSDLALRDFDCQNPCPNFLYTTDSRFLSKGWWAFLYNSAYNYDAYKDKRLLNPIKLLEAMEFVTKLPLAQYISMINSTISELREGYKTVAHLPLEREFYENNKIDLLSERYNLMKYLSQRFETYKNDRPSLSEDDTYNLLIQWCNEYPSKKYEHTEL